MFGSAGLPHGFCFLWNPELLWLHVGSDSLIALAYFLIPIALVRILRTRKDIPFNGVLFCFAAFIIACGVTHAMEVVTLWHPIYWVSGALKALTAVISLVTLVLLVRISPALLALPHRLADQRFRELIEDAPDAILQVDAGGIILVANRTAERIFGYSREELLGSNVDMLVPRGNRKSHPHHRDQFLRAGVTRPMGGSMGDLHARRKDGTEISVEIGLSQASTGTALLAIAVIRDITERRRMEAELERTRQRLNSVLNSTLMCVYAVDSNWRFTFVNENAFVVLKELGDVIGMDMRTAFPGQEASTIEKIEGVMETREPAEFDSYYAPADLSTHVSVYPLDDGGITIYFADISVQKRLEEALERERASSIQRTEVLARLSSSLAHEIKNPLAIIHARASDLGELASEGEVSQNEINKACASIVGASDRAIRILRGVAAMARVGTHDPMAPASMGEIVQQAVDLVRGRYTRAAILLETQVPPGLPLLECRDVQISQIMVNLLNNAFDAVEGDARSERWVRVIVSLQPGAEHENHIDQMQISVVDGGLGVAPEHRERLMQTFFTTKSAGAGIGIGLSVSRTIAEEHGGQLELMDFDGHTCFRLTLPVKDGTTEEVGK
jgi:PAS domain S-box-containing protein